jgi:hypothetical protein
VKFNIINRKVKLFGTSTNLYKISFRQKSSVKRALFPITQKRELEKRGIKKIHCMLMPSSKLLFIWNMLIMVCVGYIVTFMPYYMVFDHENLARTIIEYVLNFIFILDMILMFFSSYYD